MIPSATPRQCRLGSDTDGAVWTSPDGVTWSRVPHDEAVFGDADRQSMRSVVAVGSRLVAAGDDASGGNMDAAVWTSSYGVTWSRVPHGEAVFGGADDYQEMSSIVSVDSGLVAAGHDGPWYDADAAVWYWTPE